MDNLVTLPRAVVQAIADYLRRHPWEDVDDLMQAIKESCQPAPPPIRTNPNDETYPND